MNKILGVISHLIKWLFTKSSIYVDPQTIGDLKAKNPPEALLEKTDELLKLPIPEIPGTGQVWENTLGNVVVHPALTIAPASLSALVSLVKEAEAGNHTIRAVGSGHSFSDVAASDDFLVFTHQLNEPLTLDNAFLKDSAKKLKLVETQSGITLAELNNKLDAKNLALSTMGSYDAQTLIGAISTGTHGTGLEPGSMSGMVRSLVLVSSQGRLMRVEPTEGITDSNKFNMLDWTLVQDDDTFYSVLVSMGCMGLIYSVIIEVLDTYWLEENRTFSNWHLVKPKLIQGSVFNENRHYEVQVNPYKTIGTHTCLVTTQNIVPEKIGADPIERGNRNFLSALLDMIPLAPEVIRLFLDTFPKKIPRTIDSALKHLVDEPDYFNKSYKVLNEGLPHFKRIGYASEFAFPLANNKYLDAVEKIFEVAASTQKKASKFLYSPLSLRFVKASNAYMTMDYGADTCLIDITTLFGSNNGNQMLDIIQDAMLALGGRPHWGKINDIKSEIVKTFYPKFPHWAAIREKLDPQHTFTNNFTRRFEF